MTDELAKAVFPVGVPVDGNALVGRAADIARLKELLLSRQSVSLIAPRRYGKTSLALEVLRAIQSKQITCIDVDLFRASSQRDLAQMLIAACLRTKGKNLGKIFTVMKDGISALFGKLEFKQVINDYEIVLKFAEDNRDDSIILEESIEFLEQFASKEKKLLIVYLDEFGEIGRLGGEPLIKKLRAIMQRQRKVVYLFSGSQVQMLNQLFKDRKAPFYNFATVVHLDTPDSVAMAKYLRDKFAELGIKHEESIPNEILAMVHNHPYYMQLVGKQIYIMYKMGEIRKMISSDLEIVKSRIVLEEAPYYYELTNSISSYVNGMKVLKALVMGNNAYSSDNMDKQHAYLALRKLVLEGYIMHSNKGEYRVIDPFYGYFLQDLWKE